MTGKEGNAIVLGMATILFGYKVFIRNWLPFTKGKNIVVSKAKGIGVCCIILGLTMIL